MTKAQRQYESILAVLVDLRMELLMNGFNDEQRDVIQRSMVELLDMIEGFRIGEET